MPSRDGDPVEQLIAALAEIKRHIQDANEFLASLPVAECPEGKLTEELCRRYPKRLFVWMLAMEEFQNKQGGPYVVINMRRGACGNTVLLAPEPSAECRRGGFGGGYAYDQPG